MDSEFVGAVVAVVVVLAGIFAKWIVPILNASKNAKWWDLATSVAWTVVKAIEEQKAAAKAGGVATPATVDPVFAANTEIARLLKCDYATAETFRAAAVFDEPELGATSVLKTEDYKMGLKNG